MLPEPLNTAPYSDAPAEPGKPPNDTVLFAPMMAPFENVTAVPVPMATAVPPVESASANEPDGTRQMNVAVVLASAWPNDSTLPRPSQDVQ